MIDKKTHEIRQDDDKVVYKSLDEIAEDLPDNSPRYILLSYPLTLVCCCPLRPSAAGRVVPYLQGNCRHWGETWWKYRRIADSLV